MKKIHFYQLLIIFLVLLNGITITVFYFKKPNHHGQPDPKEIVELLQLNGEKTEHVLALQKDHFQRKEVLVKNRNKWHLKLFNTFYDDKIDQSTIDSLIDKIVENERQIETMTFAYFKKINLLCNDTQKSKLKSLIRRVLTHQHLPPPGR